MKAQEMQALIARDEGQTLEFKKSVGQLRRAVETVVAFANTRGGHLLIGVRQDGEIVGVEGAELVRRTADVITDNTDPVLYPSIEAVEADGKQVIVVTVVESEDKPHLAYGHGYRRVGSTSKRMSRDELELTLMQRRPTDFERRPVAGATLSDLNEEKLRRYFAERAPGAEHLDQLSLADLALGQGLVIRLNGQAVPTAAGVMLFGRAPQALNDNWGITALRVRGPDISYPIVDRREIGGTAEQLIERGRQFVADHMHIAYEFPEDSARRREIAEYPLNAVREALANAVTHRDYRPNERTQLRLYDGRLEVQNPGGLLPGLTLEQVLSQPTPRRRNHLIAQVLLEWGYAEQVGRGLMRIHRWMQELGSEEPGFESTASHFLVRLPSRHQA
ncbi:MAG: putative DNA binding domain-containing protein [Anaerolineales bacterium]|nr:putative DNA binding domain-containing protein [Anaerolineales bacterium]